METDTKPNADNKTQRSYQAVMWQPKKHHARKEKNTKIELRNKEKPDNKNRPNTEKANKSHTPKKQNK